MDFVGTCNEWWLIHSHLGLPENWACFPSSYFGRFYSGQSSKSTSESLALQLLRRRTGHHQRMSWSTSHLTTVSRPRSPGLSLCGQFKGGYGGSRLLCCFTTSEGFLMAGGIPIVGWFFNGQFQTKIRMITTRGTPMTKRKPPSSYRFISFYIQKSNS